MQFKLNLKKELVQSWSGILLITILYNLFFSLEFGLILSIFFVVTILLLVSLIVGILFKIGTISVSNEEIRGVNIWFKPQTIKWRNIVAVRSLRYPFIFNGFELYDQNKKCIRVNYSYLKDVGKFIHCVKENLPEDNIAKGYFNSLKVDESSVRRLIRLRRLSHSFLSKIVLVAVIIAISLTTILFLQKPHFLTQIQEKTAIQIVKFLSSESIKFYMYTDSSDDFVMKINELSLFIASKYFPEDNEVIVTCNSDLAVHLKIRKDYFKAIDVLNNNLLLLDKNSPEDLNFLVHNNSLLAECYREMDNYSKAANYYSRVREICDHSTSDQVPFYCGTAYYFSGNYYLEKEQYNDALDTLERALPLLEEQQGEDGWVTGLALNRLALLYASLGQDKKSIELVNKKLAQIEKEDGKENYRYALELSNKSSYFSSMKDYEKAVDLARAALEIQQKVHEDPNNHHIIGALKVLSNNLYAKKDYHEAFITAERALEKAQAVYSKNHPKVGSLILLLGKILIDIENYEEAKDYLQKAHVIYEGNFDNSSDSLAYFYHSYAKYHHRIGNTRLAILFGKKAVNISQVMRKKNVSLNELNKKSLLESISGRYRTLADWLIEVGRLAEAEQILAMLKEQEYFQFIRRDRTERSYQTKIAMTNFESQQEQILNTEAEPLANLFLEISKLEALDTRTPVQDNELDQLYLEADEAGAKFLEAIDQMVTALAISRPDKGIEVKESQALQDTLRELGNQCVALYTVVGEESYTLILTTPDYRISYTKMITLEEFNSQIMDFRAKLTNPMLDPRPIAKELLDVILPKKARDELKAYGAKTLMWHLDGPLRLLPLSALHDGEHYLVEDYQISTFTSASKANLKDNPRTEWNGLGLGVSKSRTFGKMVFSALPSVPRELSVIIREQGERGVIPGDRQLDADFMWQSMQRNLRSKGRYPLIHIASHFHLEPGNESQSFLVPGKGEPITLNMLRSQNNLFGGVDLLTLSACNTGVGNGREVDGLSIIAQRQGAKAVIATLWPVADNSTALLMGDFYQLREKENLTKVEALRRAQVNMLRGNSGDLHNVYRGDLIDRRSLNSSSLKSKKMAGSYTTDTQIPYSHPFYWAPFVLVGNWK